MQKMIFLLMTLITISCSCQKEEDTTLPGGNTVLYTMPEESALHEGTWLQWPHQYQYGVTFRNRLDATWVSMTQALESGEKVHIVAYNETEKTRIIGLLNTAGIPLTNINFKIYATDDVWVRDNGPIYVRDSTGKLTILDWGFNGWGSKTAYANCNVVPGKIAADQNIPKIDLNNTMTLEGGSFEIDGNSTFLATKSAILNNNRNPGMTQSKAEEVLTKYLGVTNFIWLDGVAGLEITDMHIDGFARFANQTTLVTMAQKDLQEWDVTQTDIDRLYASRNKNGNAYAFVKLPLTQNNVVTTYEKNLGYKGSYINYYIANKKILVPNYNDPNDAVANNIIQNLYPGKTVVGIDVRNLYANGGMVHCVTQQQPQ
jgi:agmatine deiminase